MAPTNEESKSEDSQSTQMSFSEAPEPMQDVAQIEPENTEPISADAATDDEILQEERLLDLNDEEVSS